ncbi:MAG: peptidase S41, partial [Candidatus Eisenbacteria bacterium]|nr:peptidase S41 [Candidatus Eisenbacteria bacterium]
MMRASIGALGAAVILIGLGSGAGADVSFPRHPAPSPDGNRIAFSHQGDIWVVAATGGLARRLTGHEGYDGHPVWSPQGDRIAFASDRDGNDDVYVIPADAGEVQRLTYHSGSDLPCDWTPDGSAVLFQTRRDIRDGWNRALYVVPAAGGTPHPFFSLGAR